MDKYAVARGLSVKSISLPEAGDERLDNSLRKKNVIPTDVSLLLFKLVHIECGDNLLQAIS